MRVRCSTASALTFGSILATGCSSHSPAMVTAPVTATPWSGCYVVTWVPRPPEWLKGMDSIRLASSTSLDSSRSRWHHVPYATTRHYDEGYFGPFWYVRADSLVIVDGVLSGWELSAVRSDSGFTGRGSTFTDVIPSDPPLTWTVKARRVACSSS